MKILPVITEKSLADAKEGNYTFYVDRNMNKYQIAKLVEEVFGVHVTRVRTINLAKLTKKNFKGVKQVKQPRKKAMVSLKDKEKIDIFEEIKQ